MEFYVQILNKDTQAVVKEMGPLGERQAERVERGVNINLNHEDYYTIIEEK